MWTYGQRTWIANALLHDLPQIIIAVVYMSWHGVTAVSMTSLWVSVIAMVCIAAAIYCVPRQPGYSLL